MRVAQKAGRGWPYSARPAISFIVAFHRVAANGKYAPRRAEKSRRLRGVYILTPGREDHRLKRPARLLQYDVVKLLEFNRAPRTQPGAAGGTVHDRAGGVSVRFRIQDDIKQDDIRPGPQAAAGARIAVAVPKRLLKLAVQRNSFKRRVREAFRHHEIRHSPVDLLVSLTAPPALARAGFARQMPQLIKSAFDQVSRRLQKFAAGA